MDPPSACHRPMRDGRRLFRRKAFRSSEACGPSVPRVHDSLAFWWSFAGAPWPEVIAVSNRCFSHVTPPAIRANSCPGLCRRWRIGPPLPCSPNAWSSQSSSGSHRFFLAWPRGCVYSHGTPGGNLAWRSIWDFGGGGRYSAPPTKGSTLSQ